MNSPDVFQTYAVYVFDASERAYIFCDDYEQKAYALKRGIVVAADHAEAGSLPTAPVIVVGISDEAAKDGEYSRKMKRAEIEKVGVILHEQTIDVKKVIQEAYGADDEETAASPKPPRQQGPKKGRPVIAIVVLLLAVGGFYKLFFSGSDSLSWAGECDQMVQDFVSKNDNFKIVTKWNDREKDITVRYYNLTTGDLQVSQFFRFTGKYGQYAFVACFEHPGEASRAKQQDDLSDEVSENGRFLYSQKSRPYWNGQELSVNEPSYFTIDMHE